jgi:UrcA family protein
MRTTEKTHTIRKKLATASFALLLAIPAAASASLLNTSPGARDANAQPNLASPEGQAVVYERLKDESRDVCGSSNVRIAGSIERATENDACYEQTLSVAVKRVGNDGLSKLHQNSL